jgi:Asp-tRNA(Asn)/Glu-tRNA(Gln) amidotransferase A subunit family amidase
VDPGAQRARDDAPRTSTARGSSRGRRALAHVHEQPPRCVQRRSAACAASRAAMRRPMERCDIMLSPTIAQPAPPPRLPRHDRFEIHFGALRSYAAFTPSRRRGCAAISLPLGGAPRGSRSVSPRCAARGDRPLLELARRSTPTRPGR